MIHNCRQDFFGGYTLKGKKSWRKQLFRIAFALLISIFVYMIWSTVNYYKWTKQQYDDENKQAVSVWKNDIDSILSMTNKHIRELLMTMNNDKVEIKPGSPDMSFLTKVKCIQVMEDKLSLGTDVSCMFIYDTDKKSSLFSAVSGSTAKEVMAVKTFVNSGEVQTSALSDEKWYIVTIDDNSYCTRAIANGKYVVGAMCNINAFAPGALIKVLSSDVSCFIETAGITYSVLENEAITNDSLFSDSGVSVYYEEIKKLDAKIIFAAKAKDLSVFVSDSVVLFVLFGFLCMMLFVALIIVTGKNIISPTNTLLEAIDKVQKGDLDYRIKEDASSKEFDDVFLNFNIMVDEIKRHRIERYDNLIQKKQDELQLLRAQIRPHFFLNAITTVSNMSYSDDQEKTRQYLKELAAYMRYMLNNRDKFVKLGTELSEIESYVKMQAIRAPGSIEVDIESDNEANKTDIPYLLVFTIVENAFKHAMNMYETLHLHIVANRLPEGDKMLTVIAVEDNGAGFPQDVLDKFGNYVDIPPAKDHIGLSNVFRTLALTYNRADLIRLSNTENGARVIICIPDREESNHETFDM